MTSPKKDQRASLRPKKERPVDPTGGLVTFLLLSIHRKLKGTLEIAEKQMKLFTRTKKLHPKPAMHFAISRKLVYNLARP